MAVFNFLIRTNKNNVCLNVNIIIAFCIICLSGCASFKAEMSPSAYEQFESAYKEAFNCFENGLSRESEIFCQQALALLESDDESILSKGAHFKYSIESRLLYLLCYNKLMAGDEEYVYQKTRWALNSLKGDEQYIYLKDCFSIIHVVNTGDLSLSKEIFQKCDSLLDRGNLRMNVLEKLVDRTFVDIFLVYLDLNSGNIKAAEKLQNKLEKLYGNLFMKGLLLGGKVLGINKKERAILFSIAGYGYGQLGRYHDSAVFYKRARKILDGVKKQELNWLKGATDILYAHISLFPSNMLANAKEKISQGISKLKLDDTSSSSIYGSKRFKNDIFIPYGQVVSAKCLYYEKKYDQCIEMANAAIIQSNNATPKFIILDALYYTALAQKKIGVVDNSILDSLVKGVEHRLDGYKGWDLWKLHYAKSVNFESKNHIDGAISSIRKAISIIEKLRENRFDLISQQLTFMEDKSAPYDRFIDLLRTYRLDDELSKYELFLAIEKMKVNSYITGASKKRKISKIGPRNIVDVLGSDEAVIQMYYGGGALISMMLDHQELKVSVIHDKVGIRNTVDVLRRSMDGHDLKTFDECSNNIYEAFLKPFEEDLASMKKVYIIAYGDLNYVPWYALKVDIKERVAERVIDKIYCVSVLPYASIVLSKMQPIDYSKQVSIFLNKIGIPLYDNVGLKIEKNHRVLDKHNKIQEYTGDESNVGLFLEKLRAGNNIVFFGHGFFDKSSPLESSIIFNDTGLSLLDIPDYSIKSDFVVLAGCQTGLVMRYSEMKLKDRSDVFRSENDMVGLYKVFLNRGAKSLIVTLSKINPHETRKFIRLFLSLYYSSAYSDFDQFFKQLLLMFKKDRYSVFYWGSYNFIRGG